MPGLRRCLCLLLLLTCLGGLTRCGVHMAERGGATPPARSPGQDPAQDLFREAERAYQQKDYGRARALFHTLASDYPQSPLLDDASFRLGEILYYERHYEASQQAFTAFLTRFPDSRLAPDAAHLLGLNLLHLRRFPQARAVLEQAQRQASEPQQQGLVALTLAEVSMAEGQSLRALDELRTVMRGPPFAEEVRRQAKDFIIELVAHRITSKDLEHVKRRWPLEFPTDYVLLRQAQEAWNRQDEGGAQAFGEEFLTKFPDHPQGQEMRTLIVTIAQARHVRVDREKIGVILPLSSPPGREWVREVGESALHGIQLALAREGFSPLKMEVRDSKADVRTTAAVADELIHTQHVMAIVGPILNETTEVAARKASQSRVPLITPGAPASEFPDHRSYVFRNSLTNRLEARRLAEYAVGPLGLRRLAILHPDDRAGRELADTFRSRAVELGGEVISLESYDLNQVDFTPQMRRMGGKTDEMFGRGSAIAGSGPTGRGGAEAGEGPGWLPYEALYLPRSFERLEFLVPTLTLFNITGITLLGESGWNHPELIRRAGTFVEGAIFMDGFFVDSSDPQVREFVQTYRAMFQGDPDLMAAQSYDAMSMLLRVLKQRPQTREEVKEGLLKIRDFLGVTGRASTLMTGDMDKRLFVLTVRGGQIVQLN